MAKIFKNIDRIFFRTHNFFLTDVIRIRKKKLQLHV